MKNSSVQQPLSLKTQPFPLVIPTVAQRSGGTCGSAVSSWATPVRQPLSLEAPPFPLSSRPELRRSVVERSAVQRSFLGNVFGRSSSRGEKPQISPLRCAPVEMTKGRVALPGTVVAERGRFFNHLGWVKGRAKSSGETCGFPRYPPARGQETQFIFQTARKGLLSLLSLLSLTLCILFLAP
jgi:hypothetical protein